MKPEDRAERLASGSFILEASLDVRRVLIPQGNARLAHVIGYQPVQHETDRDGEQYRYAKIGLIVHSAGIVRRKSGLKISQNIQQDDNRANILIVHRLIVHFLVVLNLIL